MRKNVITAIALVAPLWLLTIPAFGEPEQDQAKKSEVVVDSPKTETEMPTEIVVEDYEADENKEDLNSEMGKKELDILGLLGLIFGAIGVLASGFVWYDGRKKITALQTVLNEKNDLEIHSTLKSSQTKVEELDKLCSRLNTDYAYLRKDFTTLVERLNKKFQTSNSVSTLNVSSAPQSARSSDVGNFKQTAEHRSDQNPALQTTYVSSLSIDDRGEYSIPMYSLEPGNTQALFKVLFDPQKGEGTYELNPNLNNLSVYIDTLKMCAEGLVASKTSGYKTLIPGKLKREGSDLKVVTKLQIG